MRIDLLSPYEGPIEAGELTADGIRADLLASNEPLSAIDDRLRNLRTVANSCLSQLKTLRDSSDELNEQLTNHQISTDEAYARANALKTEMDETVRRIASLRDDLQTLRAELDALQPPPPADP